MREDDHIIHLSSFSLSRYVATNDNSIHVHLYCLIITINWICKEACAYRISLCYTVG